MAGLTTMLYHASSPATTKVKKKEKMLKKRKMVMLYFSFLLNTQKYTSTNKKRPLLFDIEYEFPPVSIGEIIQF